MKSIAIQGESECVANIVRSMINIQTTLDSSPISYKNVLLSFMGKFPALIYQGIKEYEIRKSNMLRITLKQSKAYIYEVKPVGKVTGCFQINQITPTVPHLAIVHLDLDTETRRYVANLEPNERIYVITVGECRKFNEPIEIKNPPRSWRYLTTEEQNYLKMI